MRSIKADLNIQGVVTGRSLALRLLDLVARVEIPTFDQSLYYMSKKPCPSVYRNSLYKHGHDFFNIQYYIVLSNFKN